MALKIKSLSATNFRPFREFHLPFPDKNGLYYIEGRNETASYTEYNGVGKSSLLDLPSIALFARGVRDSDSRKLVLTDYIRYMSKEATVKMEFEDMGTGISYTVSRNLRKGTAKSSGLQIEYGDTITKGADAQKFISDKLGLSFDSFNSSCLFGQNKFNKFLTATKGEKMEFIKDLFKVTIIDEKRKDIKIEYEQLNDDFISQSSSLSISKSELSATEAKLMVLKDLYNSERVNEEKSLEVSKTRKETLSKELDDLLIIQKRASNDLLSLNSTVLSLEGVLASSTWTGGKNRLEVGKPCPTCRRIVEETEEDKDWREHQEAKRIKHEDLQNQLTHNKTAQGKLEEEVQQLDLKTAKLLQEKELLDAEMIKSKERLSVSDTMISDAQYAYDLAKNAYDVIEKQVSETQDKRDKLDRLYKILGKSELTAKIVNKYLPTVNYYARKYVSFLTNGELSLKFSFVNNEVDAEVIDTINGIKTSYFGYSGGESRRLDFAVFLAFNQVNRHVLQNPLQILMLDETFDALDKMGIERCIQLLQEEKNEIGVILITGHSEDIGALFDNKIQLVKRNGVTNLV